MIEVTLPRRRAEHRPGLTRRRLIVATASAVAGTTVSGHAGLVPAAVGDMERLAPHRVVGGLQKQGFYGFGGLRYRPDANLYVLRAYGPRGRFVHVIVDARDGRVLETRPLDRPARKGRWGF